MHTCICVVDIVNTIKTLFHTELYEYVLLGPFHLNWHGSGELKEL